MMIEVEEAYKFTCPFMTTTMGEPMSCLGGNCMLWEYTDPENMKNRRGFCGLAQK